MILPKTKNVPTFLKYLLSYVLVFTVLMSAFFLILRSQLTAAYSSQRTERIQGQMAAVQAHLSSEILFLSQIDTLINNNPDLILATFKADGKTLMVAEDELTQYADASSLIDSIVYHAEFSGHVFSTAVYATWNGNAFELIDPAGKVILFNPAPYLDASAGQLIWLAHGQTKYLLYFPNVLSVAQSTFFYILDTRLIQSQLKGLVSAEVPGVALLDGAGNYVTGYGFEPYLSTLEGAPLSTGIHPVSGEMSLFVSNTLQSGFSIATVISEDYLADQVDRAFMRAFFSLLGLSLLGIGVVYVAMLFTYRPLRRLVQTLGHDTGRNQNYLELISRNYSELSDQKSQLEQTLAQYRESMAQYRKQRTYPNDTLGRLSASLREKRFGEARELIEALLVPSEEAPGYFLSCIVLDCLTLINNSMSQACIRFETYRDVFTEAVRQCRDIPNSRNIDTLKSLINELLFFYEQEAVDKRFQVTPLRQMVEVHFCDPDFSISVIAEAYHVSDSRMSNLFKDEMGMGFLEYVWKMRLEKAQTLLRDTQLSVEEISLAVGYLVSTSFSRKFKQETGLTPSQYRQSSRELTN